MNLQEKKALISKFIEEAINKKNLAVIDSIVDVNFVEHLPFPGQGPGADGLKQVIGMMTTAFPDMHWTLEEQIAEGEKVVSRFTWTGSHEGEFMGILPTHKKVTVWGIVIDEISNEKFTASRILMDTTGLIQQLEAN